MAVVMASDEGKKVILISSDGVEFLVEEAVAIKFQIIRDRIESGCADNVFPLFNVNSEILSKVIEYCKKHVDSAAEEDLKGWDSNFVKAANYLNIKGLLDLTCQTVADMFKGETPEKIRKIFNIKEAITPEEEEEIRRENQWAFD